MCKIFVINGIPNLKDDSTGYSDASKFEKFVQAASYSLIKSEQHGFGYMAARNQAVFGERWQDVSEMFKQPDAKTAETWQALGLKATYNAFGDRQAKYDWHKSQSICLHARTSTNTISIENTHPFVEKRVHVIHNGVITNHADVEKTLSTCDSEAILKHYLAEGVALNPENMQRVVDKLQGWFAFAVLAETDTGLVLDVVRDNRADLYFAVIPQFQHVKVWSTSRETILEACKAAGISTPLITQVPAFTHVRLDAETGKILSAAQLKFSAPPIPIRRDTYDIPPKYREDYVGESDYLAEIEDDYEDTEIEEANRAILEEMLLERRKYR